MANQKRHYPSLTERQEAVFTAVLQQYVTSARAVGSRNLAKRLTLDLSPATVRNVMADLEEMGMLSHPHTSAGRVPTTLGYGYYVDSMMHRVELTDDEQREFSQALKEVMIGGVNEVLDRAGETLARVSTLISVVLSPRMADGILHKIDLVRIATGRLLVVLSIRNGFVRSILLEISSTLKDEEIDAAKRLLNERLSGLTLGEVRHTIDKRLAGVSESSTPLIKLVVDSADHIFRPDRVEEIHVDGTRNVLDHPEFANMDQMKAVIEILEDRDVIMHLLEKGQHKMDDGVRISIGEELGQGSLESCSVVTAGYSLGDTEGTLGIIGPTRMDYARVVSLVNFAASTLNRRLID
ncbi:heat-inducible transcriptional repressor HrcA [bacterium]|nr:heat-inducible transcriptional repressor HrcA [bacterium]